MCDNIYIYIYTYIHTSIIITTRNILIIIITWLLVLIIIIIIIIIIVIIPPRSHGPPQDREHRPPLRAEACGRQLRVPCILPLLLLYWANISIITMMCSSSNSSSSSCCCCCCSCSSSSSSSSNSILPPLRERAKMPAYCYSNDGILKKQPDNQSLQRWLHMLNFDVYITTQTSQTRELARMIADFRFGAEIKARNRLCRPSYLSFENEHDDKHGNNDDKGAPSACACWTTPCRPPSATTSSASPASAPPGWRLVYNML